jgi:hypothetical protein
MPKITVHGGPSNEHDERELPQSVADLNELDKVLASANRSEEQADNRELYEAETVADLRVELERRGLEKAGYKAELVDRLVENDAAPPEAD